MPEIDAGGLSRALTTQLPAIELTDNRRQQHGWEQAALDELRHGNPDTALTAYQAHGRIRTADTAGEVQLQAGDRIVCLRNAPRPGVVNASSGVMGCSAQLLSGSLKRLHTPLERETGGFPWPRRRQLIHALHTEHDQTVAPAKMAPRSISAAEVQAA